MSVHRIEGREGGATGRRPEVAAVVHAVALMRCIAGAGAPVGVNEIARRIGLHKSSVSRLVSTLERERLVRRDPATARVALGLGIVALAAPVLATLDVKDAARPYLEDLATRSGETVSLSIWDGEQAVSVEQALGASAVRTYAAPGRRNPGHCTAAGKMLLAHAGPEAWTACLAGPLAAHTPRTITDPEALATELDRIRARGYALNEGELEPDVGAVSAPVMDRRRRVVATVTATVPIYRFGRERRRHLVELVVAAAGAISAELGLLAAPA